MNVLKSGFAERTSKDAVCGESYWCLRVKLMSIVAGSCCTAAEIRGEFSVFRASKSVLQLKAPVRAYCFAGLTGAFVKSRFFAFAGAYLLNLDDS